MRVACGAVVAAVLAGCGTGGRGTGPNTNNKAANDARVPGFVVYSTGGDNVVGVAIDGYETVIVPVVGKLNGKEDATLNGLWVLDDATRQLGAAGVAGCDCPDVCGDPDAIAWRAPDIVRAGAATCSAPGWRGLVGGTLYGAGEEHSDVCATGLNIYSLTEDTSVLVPGEAPDLNTGYEDAHQFWSADGGTPGGELDSLAVSCEAHDGVWTVPDPEDDVDCSDAERGVGWASEVPRLWGGLLVRVRDLWYATAMGPREVAYGPVTPAQCPSQADTCGGPDRFRHAPSIKAALNVDPGHFEAVMRPFWVNNAETWALVHDHEAGWSVWAANATEPTRGVIALTETAPAAGIGAHVIGVRWHDDLRPLLARTCEALCHAPSIATPTNDEETDDEELYFNDKCEETFQLGFTCASAAEDESCFGDGGEDEGNGGDSEDSEGGDTEDTEDAAEVVLDTRTTKELGNACFTHIKSGELTTAEAECRLALTRADNDRSRGALHYNLGLIAEARGDKAGAKSAYATSLRFRPGNQAVMDRLKALE